MSNLPYHLFALTQFYIFFPFGKPFPNQATEVQWIVSKMGNVARLGNISYLGKSAKLVEGPVINSCRVWAGRHLRGGAKILPPQREGE